MTKRIMVGGFLLTGVLLVIAGLRDIFAPGLFTMSSRIMGKGDIIFEFVAAAVFFALVGLTIKRADSYGSNKK